MENRDRRAPRRRLGVLLFAFWLTWAGLPCSADVPPPAEPSTAPEIYGAGVRPTAWRNPSDEQSGFHLPAGLEIELVASEPQIHKPMNMAFAADGSLWVTHTIEYPYAAPPDQPARDGVIVLRDRDGDGSLESVEPFITGLNIPIGILPYGDGCLCFSIPSIEYLRDTDGDGRCDRREVILGPFDTTRDTHGMINALRMGADGWVYACHGFNNQSEVAGHDGHRVRLLSGNMFRFRPDGSRVELFSQGQVNPFGMTQDDWGQWYVADCHSKPLTQNLRGACYTSFGRPHDGLGFAPEMMDHLHGSTAISGVAWIPPQFWPAWPDGGFVSGNVMTSRLNRNALVRQGATVRGQEVADLLTSDDSWFRPVDIQLGPDDCLYIADFYNKIIGHYEVPLDHPERDRTSGRIWRVKQAGQAHDSRQPSLRMPLDDPRQLTATLGSPNPARRSLAREALISVWDAAPSALRAALDSDLDEILFNPQGSAPQRSEILWIRYRTGRPLDPAQRATIQSDPNALLRAHAFRALTEFPPDDLSREELIAGLHDQEPRVVQVAAGACITSGKVELAEELLKRTEEAVQRNDDPVLKHSLRIALRDLWMQPGGSAWLERQAAQTGASIRSSARALIADLAPALPQRAAADLLIDYLLSGPSMTSDQWQVALQHAAQYASQNRVPQLIELIGRAYEDRPIDQLALLDRVSTGLKARGEPEEQSLHRWSATLLDQLLAPLEAAPRDQPLLIGWTDQPGPAWGQEPRFCGEEAQPLPLVSSLTRGEQYVGIRSSTTFTAPPELAFWLAGHNGFPDQPDHRLNRVRLVDAETGRTLREAFPPRNDRAVRIHWDLVGDGVSGRAVRIQCEDADPGSAYAWLAMGGFSYEPLEAAASWGERFAAACRLVRDHGDPELIQRFASWATDRRLSLDQRGQAALALTAHQAASHVTRCLLEAAIQPPMLSSDLIDLLVGDLQSADATDPKARLREVVPLLSRMRQIQLARRLAERRDGAELLLDEVEQGTVSNAVLFDRDLRQRLDALYASDLAPRAEEMAGRVHNDDLDAHAALAADTQRALERGDGDRERGHRLFTKHCANCHQLAGEGKVVGPQLEGVGQRGSERLLEDILTPDRNVDAAFRTSTLVMSDGRVLAGLIRAEDDRELRLVTNDGQEQVIALEDVESRHSSPRSLMPADLAAQLPPHELADLLRYLIDTAQRKP